MTTDLYRHGDATTDAALYAAVGAWVLDKNVHERLGVGVSSEPGDVWILSRKADGVATGFVQMRLSKSKTLHVRFLFAADDKPETENVLVRAALRHAAAAGATVVYTNDRIDSRVWSKHGFAMRDTGAKRGSFRRWERALETKNAVKE